MITSKRFCESNFFLLARPLLSLLINSGSKTLNQELVTAYAKLMHPSRLVVSKTYSRIA